MLIFMDAKVRLDLREGIIELEGSEEFVKKYLDEFKPLLNKTPNITSQTPQSQYTQKNLPLKKKENFKSPNKGFPKIPEPIQFDGRGDEKEKPSLVEFITQKNPQSNREIIVCVAFYLKRIFLCPSINEHFSNEYITFHLN
jgi:hypothetical protein